ncbi:hypothetical protein HPB52_020256 [Rhipicephalus sanguineus]|uniref:CCHC-type domain-containing protein n=1 Tax=Rhipicephalus sanguineus TaxID=34632 RepID=A0A9D4Q387_RHISA|nr:hypothetical protein HPB52_020256 [Rhipicephalus sanguineus]
MANSDQLRKKRGAIRAGVTRALTLLTDLLQQPDPDASQISGHMDYLKDREKALSQLDDVILATTDEQNLDQEVGMAQEYNENILSGFKNVRGMPVLGLEQLNPGLATSDLRTPATQQASIAETPEDRTRLAKDMLTFLRIQVEIREEGRQLSRRALQDEPRTRMPEEIYGAEPLPSASALTGSTLPVRPACLLCQSKDHMIAFCNANLSAEEKRARLKYANCCFRCGTRNHIARLCRKSINLRCGTCQRRHLTFLCELSTPTEDLQSSGGSPAFHEPPPQPMRNVTTAQSSHVESTPVLLQTGRVWAESGDRRLLVRILLDSGSQRTYIRADVAKILKCSVVGNEELSIVTFGGSNQFGASPVTLEALTIHEICSVTSLPLDPNILHLLGEREYNVADSFQPTTWQPEEISVLIGSDAYWQVTTGRIDRINERLTAIDTTFGWMVQGPVKSDMHFPSSALFISSSDSSAADLDVPSMRCLDVIGIDGAHSRTLEGSHHLFGSELGISKRNKNHPVDNAVASGRKASMSTLILAAHVVIIGDRMGVTPHLRNLSQIGYFMCEHHDEDSILEILHAEYIVIKHVKNDLHAIRVGLKDGKGEQALPKAKRAARRNSCAVCRLRKSAQVRFDRTTQMERKHGVHECKGRNSSFDGNVNAMEDNLAQVNDLDHVPLFELLPISGEDTSVVSLDESNEASKLLVSTLGLEGTCMKLLQQSFPKTTENISQRKRMPLEELKSLEEMFVSVNQPFPTLHKGTEPWNCQMLPKMNFDIGMDTNVVHVDENKENAVAEKAMNSSYIRLPHLINDLNITGLMITDKPLKSSPYRWLSWKSIRPRRRVWATRLQQQGKNGALGPAGTGGKTMSVSGSAQFPPLSSSHPSPASTQQSQNQTVPGQANTPTDTPPLTPDKRNDDYCAKQEVREMIAEMGSILRAEMQKIKEDIMADVKYMVEEVIKQAMSDMKQFISTSLTQPADSLPHDTNSARDPRRSHPYTRPGRSSTVSLITDTPSNHGQQT